jgi:shikimate kinase
MGSGKNRVGAIVAERSGAPFHDLDLMVEREAGMTIAEIFASKGEAGFRSLESRLLPAALEPGAVAALGGGAPIDDRNWIVITDRAETVFLDASFDVIWSRVGGAANRPLAANRSRDELQALLEQRRPRYEQATHRVDADRTPELIAEEVLTLWSA